MMRNKKGVPNERRRQSLRIRKPDSIAKNAGTESDYPPNYEKLGGYKFVDYYFHDRKKITISDVKQKMLSMPPCYQQCVSSNYW
uniref:Uncharacterized protein n=1 Tax=Brassica oleracea TaxID=3712 RepID=A0A3P6GN35_BRAOL|nr:unnamed protein product [Brassica oleracea]